MTPTQSKEIAALEEAILWMDKFIADEQALRMDSCLHVIRQAASQHLAIMKAEAAGEWKFAPREATDEMLIAANSNCSGPDVYTSQVAATFTRLCLRADHRAMLSKAPAFEGGV